MLRSAAGWLGNASRGPGIRERRSVRIGNGKFAKNFTLGPFHCDCVFAPFVIVADEVEETMDREMGKMMGKRLSLGAGLARNGLEGKNDVAKMVGNVFRWE